MIKGENIYLRPILKSDIGYLNDWKNDEETYMFLGGGFMPVSIDQQEKWLDSLIDATENNKRYIICNYEHTPLGMVGLYGINWIHRTCEIGMYLGNRDSQGKGLGTEACNLIEKFAVEYLNLRKINLKVVKSNEKAMNMWKRLGFIKIGEFNKERFVKGQYYNLILMEKFIQ